MLSGAVPFWEPLSFTDQPEKCILVSARFLSPWHSGATSSSSFSGDKENVQDLPHFIFITDHIHFARLAAYSLYVGNQFRPDSYD
jgi:hypothetical protein